MDKLNGETVALSASCGLAARWFGTTVEVEDAESAVNRGDKLQILLLSPHLLIIPRVVPACWDHFSTDLNRTLLVSFPSITTVA